MADSLLKTSLVSSTRWRIIYGRDDNRKNFQTKHFSANNVLKLSGGCELWKKFRLARGRKSSNFTLIRKLFDRISNNLSSPQKQCQSKQVKFNFEAIWKTFRDDKFIFKST